MPIHLSLRWLLPLALFCQLGLSSAAPDFPGYSRADARYYVLDDFCKRDCAGYLDTHSPSYRRTYARALDGNTHALQTVLLERRFHSGDNESWEPVSGNLMYIVGDARFDHVLSTMSSEDQRFVMTYIYDAGFLHDAYERGDKGLFAKYFPLTYRRYVRFYPS